MLLKSVSIYIYPDVTMCVVVGMAHRFQVYRDDDSVQDKNVET